MVDKKVTEYTELIAVDYEDIAYIVDNPSGTPVSKKFTAQNLVKGGANEGACSALIDANLTASKNLVSDGSGKIATTDTEYVDKSGDTMTGNLTIELSEDCQSIISFEYTNTNGDILNQREKKLKEKKL